MLHERTLKDWTEFDRIVRSHGTRQWIYRGQTDATYDLQSSLFRAFEDARRITQLATGKPKKFARRSHEQVALRKFIAVAHQFDVPLPKDEDPLEWLAVMQHYGAPTRLLDATFSPYTAAFFALRSGTEDAAIYCMQARIFEEYDASFFKDFKALIRKILDENNEDIMYAYEPKYTTPRLLAQQGLFLVPGSLQVSHEEIIGTYGLKHDEAFKLVIPAKLRKDGVAHLRRMNITSTMLFLGITGFCESFAHQPLFVVQREGRIGELEQENAGDA